MTRKDKILHNMVQRGKATDLEHAEMLYTEQQRLKGSKGGKARKTVTGFTKETASEAGKRGAEARWKNGKDTDL